MARYRIALAAMLALMAIPMAALAGSWAMASFDQVPGEFEAGSTYDLQYTILQHGETPFDVGDSQVLIVDSAGSITAFDAVPLGQPGRYSVSITFPEAGSWDWTVTMGPFASHPMGTIDVREAAIQTGGAVGSLLRWMLPVALLLVIGLIATQVAELANGRRTKVRGQGQPVRAD
jgi:hypothetical protein